jgi:hypothetical protein
MKINMKKILLFFGLILSVITQAQKLSALPNGTSVTDATKILSLKPSATSDSMITALQIWNYNATKATDISTITFTKMLTDTTSANCVKLGTYYIRSNADSVWLSKPYGIWKKRLYP